MLEMYLTLQRQRLKAMTILYKDLTKKRYFFDLF
jgi:hypothetical protein